MNRLRRWARLPLARPRLTVGVFLLLSCAWLPPLSELRLETDGRDLFAPDHPAVVFQKAVDDTFASSDFLVVGIEPAAPGSGLFAPAPLNAVLHLTRRISSLPGVRSEEVRSLATEPSAERSGGLLDLAPPLVETVRGPEPAAAVRTAALREPAFRGVLLSADGRSTAIYAPLDRRADRRALVAQVSRLIADEWARDPGLRGYRAHLVGPAAAESQLGDHVLTDLARLLPLALGLVALSLWTWFRRLSLVLVGLGEGVTVVLWTLGLMGLLGQPLSLVTVVMPVILSTYCVADTIHMAQHFSAHCRTARSRREAMEKTLDEVLSPVLFTSLTTAVGFLSFALSPIPPLRDFGLFSAFGVLSALAVSVFVVPAGLLLSRLGEVDGGVLARAGHPRATALLERLGIAAAAAPWRVLALTALVTALIGAGAFRVRIQDSWVQNFNAASPLVVSDRWFNRSFHGSNLLNVVIRPAGGTVHDPGFLRELQRLQTRLAALPEVGGGLSLVDSLRSVSRALEGSERLPRVPRESHEWCLLYRMAGGGQSLDPYLSPDGTAVNLWVFLNRADSEKTAAVASEAGRFDWQLPAGKPDVRLAGDAWLGHLLVDSIARSQRSSALAGLAATFLTVLWMLRSTSSAALAVLPVTLSVLWNFGFMGWIGLPLGVATSTFCAIAFGIGVDFALHWIARLRLGLARGLEWNEAIRFTGASTGGAILLQGLVVLLGFAVLLASSVPPNRHLALVLSVNLAASLAASLILLPAVATLLRRRFELRQPATASAALEELPI